jgi:hypothetical protein
MTALRSSIPRKRRREAKKGSERSVRQKAEDGSSKGMAYKNTAEAVELGNRISGAGS